MEINITDSKQIKLVVEYIIEKLSPNKIYIFSVKKSLQDEVTSFKIAVVIDSENTLDTEKEIYIKIESEIPFDVVVYTVEQWEKLIERPLSFVSKIMEMGVKVYG